MTRVNIQSASAITQRLVNMTVARTQLNDLNRGSAMLQLLGAVATELELCYLEIGQLLSLFSIDSASGQDLDALALLYLPDPLLRQPPLRAFGRGRFAIEAPLTRAVEVPSGAVLKNPTTGIEYITTEDAVIAIGDTQSPLVLIEARNAGSEGNTPAHTITQIVSGGRGANSFKQNVVVSGGRGAESDEELRIRIRRRVSSLAFSTNQALEGRVLDATEGGRRVVSSRIIEDTSDRGFCTLYIDDGTAVLDELEFESVNEEILESSTDEGERIYFTKNFPLRRTNVGLTLKLETRDALGNLNPPQILTENVDFEVVYSQGRIVLNPNLIVGAGVGVPENARLSITGYDRFTGLLAEAQRLVEGDTTDSNTPQYRASGVIIEVKPADKVLTSVSATIVANDGFDRVAVITEVKNNISNYINSLPIGDDVVISEIIERAMNVSGMYDITVNAPTENLTVAFNEVARILFDDVEVQ